MPIRKHVQLIAVLWMAMGAVGFIAGLFFIFCFLLGISLIPDLGREAPHILWLVGSGVGLFLWLIALPKIVCGAGLFYRREWARILILVLSFLNLLNLPLGTALGIYSLVILMKEETVSLFRGD